MKRDGLTVTSDEGASKIAEPDNGFDRSPLEPFTSDMQKYSKGIAKKLKAALKS